MHTTDRFLSLVNNRFKFRWFLLLKLPSAFFAGVKVIYADKKKCVSVVPLKWFSQNPFKSTYFACLSMAAEMSTGVLAMAHIYKRNPPVSMLVLEVQANFLKKATGKTIFTCEDGEAIAQTITEAIYTNEGKILSVKSVGRNSANEIVAEFNITWSFKTKTASLV